MSASAQPLAAMPAAPAVQTAAPAGSLGGSRDSRYLQVLTWAFTLFSSARLVSYLPTLWAICASGDSSQHSLWTWGIWLGSNTTMALWLYEQNDRRWTRAAMVNAVNAAMCAATVTVIMVFRI